MSKKILSLFLTMVLIVIVFPFSASADTSYSSAAYKTVYDGIKGYQSAIDISSYKMNGDQLASLMQDIKNNEPMFYYLGKSYSYSASISSGKITALKPKYSYTEQEIPTMNSFINSELDSILKTLPNGLDEYEKALYLHDYICVNFEYDLKGTGYHDIYNMLLYKRGVCQAYTLLYDELLLRVGIKTSAVSSDSINHIWNQVYLGGKWYHVDVTWDDPVNDAFARAEHEFFLQSDYASSVSHEANDFVKYYTSDDTSLDNLSWHSNEISFAFASGITFFVDNGVIKSVDIPTGKTVDRYKIDTVWYTASNQFYQDLNFSGLGSYDECLIFNTDKEIKYYDPLTGETGSAASLVLGNDNIYRMLVRGNKVYYMHSVRYSLNGTIDESILTFAPYDDTNGGTDNDNNGTNNGTGVYRLGDVNLDGTVDANDYILLKRAYFGLQVLSQEAIAVSDIDSNNVIDASDYILLKRAYFGTYTIN